jgi:hypothetical protein
MTGTGPCGPAQPRIVGRTGAQGPRRGRGLPGRNRIVQTATRGVEWDCPPQHAKALGRGASEGGAAGDGTPRHIFREGGDGQTCRRSAVHVRCVPDGADDLPGSRAGGVEQQIRGALRAGSTTASSPKCRSSPTRLRAPNSQEERCRSRRAERSARSGGTRPCVGPPTPLSRRSFGGAEAAAGGLPLP